MCEGCRFHELPYTFKSIIPLGDKYPDVNIEGQEDLNDYISSLVLESEEFASSRDEAVNIDYMVYQQLPFFTCQNFFIDAIYQKDISCYIYCQETGTQPHPGSYGNQPAIWIEKFFIIKKTLNNIASANRKKMEKAVKHGK